MENPEKNTPEPTEEEKIKRANFKFDTFKDIRETIEPLVKNGDYEMAQKKVKKELLLLAQALGGQELIEKRIRDLRQDLEATLPNDLKPYIKYLHPDSMAGKGILIERHAREIKTPATREQKQLPPRPEDDEGVIEKPGGIRTLELKHFKPGCVIDVKNLNTGRIVTYKILERPGRDDKDNWWVYALNINNDHPSMISLVEIGAVIGKNGRWSEKECVIRWSQGRKPPQ